MRDIHKPGKKIVEMPRLQRISLLKGVLQAYRARLDEELLPHGITTAQLRLLWAVEMNPSASGSEVARICSVTPQTGQATMARMEANGWVRRKASALSERVLVAELTAKGRKVLRIAKEIGEGLNEELWKGISERELAGLDAALAKALAQLGR